jgi:hypothetical protein
LFPFQGTHILLAVSATDELALVCFCFDSQVDWACLLLFQSEIYWDHILFTD